MFTNIAKWLCFTAAIFALAPAAPMLGPFRWAGGAAFIGLSMVLAKLEGMGMPKP